MPYWPCKTCNGRGSLGWFITRPCRDCFGTGRLQPPPEVTTGPPDSPRTSAPAPPPKTGDAPALVDLKRCVRGVELLARTGDKAKAAEVQRALDAAMAALDRERKGAGLSPDSREFWRLAREMAGH